MSARLGSLNAFKYAIFNAVLVITAVFFIHREVWVHLDLWPLLFENWAEDCLFAGALIHGWLSGAFPAKPDITPAATKWQRWSRAILPSTFFFLYIAAAALSERLVFGFVDSIFARVLGVVLIVVSIAVRIWARLTLPKGLRAGTTSGAIAKDAAKVGGTDSLLPAGGPAAVSSVETEGGNDISASAAANVSSVEPAEPTTTIALGEIRGPYKWIRFPDQAGTLIFLAGATLCFGSYMPLAALPGALVVVNWHLIDFERYLTDKLGQPYIDYKAATKRIIPRLF